MLNDLSARQALHRNPTPRIGGCAILLSFAAGILLSLDRISQELILAIGSGALVFVVGLREDICRDVSPRIRLLAAFGSGAIAAALTGRLVPGLGLASVDLLFGFTIIAISVTLLWSAGTCHALNLIDGLNGLAGSYTVFASVAIMAIAGFTGDTDIQLVAGLLAASVTGFLLLNWPAGKIFMGDAGAMSLLG
jgi:UDP-N-acetylmuramyl pentapeptide phosphotransferase/UDP-N-acetylglucosamine-1-phosphate transferase